MRHLIHVTFRRGFTLIELALVLFIIGLVIGGVLVGKDLIKSAEIRAGISQIEKYNVAVNTFKLKYDCLPGDCPDPCSLAVIPNCRTANNRNIKASDTYLGTGIINFYNGYYGASDNRSKMGVFFSQLQLANLIDGQYQTVLPTTRYVGKDAYYPPFVTGNGGGIFPFSFRGNYNAITPVPSPYNNGNKWYIGANPSFADDGTGWGLERAGGLADAMTPSQAYAIDSKIDDGIPTSGKVQAFWGVTRIVHPGNGGNFAYGSSYAQNPGVTSCASSANTYNLAGAYSNDYLCQLILDAPF